MFNNDIGLFREAKKGKLTNVFFAVILTAIFTILGQTIGMYVEPFSRVLFGNSEAGAGLNSLLCANIFVILFVYFRVRVMEGRKFSTIGFTKTNFLVRYLVGFVIGLIMFTVTILILKLAGCLAQDVNPLKITGMSALAGVLTVLPGWIVQGATEEILTRGWLMNVVGARYSAGLGLAIASTIFSILHLGNPNITVIALINIALVGLFFGLVVVKTQNLWVVCGAHSAWNWAQGNIYGFEVSGLHLPGGSLFGLKSVGPDWFTGGVFGPEAGFASTIVLIISIILVLIYINKK